MAVDINNSFVVEDRKFPKTAAKDELECLGAKYMKTENYLVDGLQRNIERMVIENDAYAIVWERKNGRDIDPFIMHYYSLK